MALVPNLFVGQPSQSEGLRRQIRESRQNVQEQDHHGLRAGPYGRQPHNVHAREETLRSRPQRRPIAHSRGARRDVAFEKGRLEGDLERFSALQRADGNGRPQRMRFNGDAQLPW